jgi:hypothetical protein
MRNYQEMEKHSEEDTEQHREKRMQDNECRMQN